MRAVALATVVALVVAGGIAAAILLTSGGTDANAAYRAKVAGVFGPVLGANQGVSDQLGHLHGMSTQDAISAVGQAQQAITRASGALSALTVPSGSTQLGLAASQAIDRETSYLTAVGSVLANPSSPSVGQVETLASDLTSALTAGGPGIAGNSSTVSGADVLTSWAPAAVRVLAARARRKAAQNHSGGSGSSTGSTTGQQNTSSNPYANGRDCGDGLYAGPDTSCAFAENVRTAYWDAPGLVAAVSVYSPVTGQEYEMDCAPAGGGVTCSGANNASVSF